MDVGIPNPSPLPERERTGWPPTNWRSGPLTNIAAYRDQTHMCLVCVDCLFLRSPSRVPYRTELMVTVGGNVRKHQHGKHLPHKIDSQLKILPGVVVSYGRVEILPQTSQQTPIYDTGVHCACLPPAYTAQAYTARVSGPL